MLGALLIASLHAFDVRLTKAQAVAIDRTTGAQYVLPGHGRHGRPQRHPSDRAELRGQTLSADGRWLALWGLCASDSGRLTTEQSQTPPPCANESVMVWDLLALSHGQRAVRTFALDWQPTTDRQRVTRVELEGGEVKAWVHEMESDCSSGIVVISVARWTLDTRTLRSHHIVSSRAPRVADYR